MRSIVRAVATLAAAAVLYELLARSGYFAPALLPTIPAIVRALIAMLANGTMIEHAAFTMYRVMFGFGLAIELFDLGLNIGHLCLSGALLVGNLVELPICLADGDFRVL